LDLQPDRSVVRRLLEAGFEVYLVDWGRPSRLDQSLGMADYVDRYMDNCVDAICARAGVDDVHLLGYCMGGSMSIMYTVLHQARVRTLGLMATPFTFDGTGGILERWARHYNPDVTVETLGNLPGELLAIEFSMMDPVDQYVSKYVRLYENIEDDEFVANFARMEQWVWDSVDVAGEAYREFINDIYQDNHLANSEYHLDGERIDLSTIEVPVLQVVGEYDHIVPAESSKPFNATVASEDERIIEFPAGHIGISVSSKAHRNLWPEVCDWYGTRSASGATPEEVADNGHATAVSAIRGIGPTYAARLDDAGIRTVADLQEHDPDELAAVADAPPARTEKWLDQLV
ncbi:MAG: alpha/beta fold hydrolase, partial [Haloarculaceae archaeon]